MQRISPLFELPRPGARRRLRSATVAGLLRSVAQLSPTLESTRSLTSTQSEFLKFVGLGEFLPFASRMFDHVLFATTLDHFVDPANVLTEAMRVLKRTGNRRLDGEKAAAAPKPARSPDWYQRLVQPALADDLFHIKRMNDGDVQALVDRWG